MSINIRATGTRPAMIKGDAIVTHIRSVDLDGAANIKSESRDRLVEEAAARLGIKFITNLVKDEAIVAEALDPDVKIETTNLKN